MLKHYQLPPRPFHRDRFGLPALDFEWDIETGELRGPDADFVARLVSDADGDVWGVHFLDGSTRVVNRCRFSMRDMAILLGFQWILPADLDAAYPAP